MTSFSYTINLQGLVDIQTKLYTLPVARMDEFDGMSYRVRDFTKSHSGLNHQFATEYMIASAGLEEHPDRDGLMNYVSNKLHLHDAGRVDELGVGAFSTDSLSPLLRHFLNDTCRILEPFTFLLKAKYSTTHKVSNPQSFKSYLESLIKSGETSFDVVFLDEFYVVWNDYKHRNTRGLYASRWEYIDGKVIKPKLILPPGNFTKLKGMDVDEFVEISTTKILEFMNTVI